MSKARFFFPDVRLKRLLREPGRITIGEALARADGAIDGMRDACLQSIDQKIAEIGALDQDDVSDTNGRCYTLSNEIYAEAGMIKLTELSDVAHNLCDLLSAGGKQGASTRAIRVHVDAMRALRSPAASASSELRRAVLGELHRLTAHLATHAHDDVVR